MNRVEILGRNDLAALSPVVPQPQRSAPRAIKVLIPVWGERYVRQFLDYGLPTLLAPENLPALAKALPTELLLLTSASDEIVIRKHAACKRLAAICKTTIKLIDYLITDGNYSTTITLAFAESIFADGQAMLDTCYFFLVSDYIMSDGSLANVLKRMQRGASAVVVGNFQVEREDALPWLQKKRHGHELSLSLSPREMMRWALANLHPTTLANTVNMTFSHNSHANRLFWRVDNDTVQGRFYLMHMICVRPETTKFVIGSSCDYSFIPEMCPSGNVEAVTDSDEYLVVEMQPRDHEIAFLRLGPMNPRRVAKGLNEWTTAVHRMNAHYPIIFHAEALPPNLTHSIEEAEKFLGEIARYLTPRPQPYRGHPYWDGAIMAFRATVGSKISEREWLFGLDLRPTSKGFVARLINRIRYTVMGMPPGVRPWHPLFPDFQIVLDAISPYLRDRSTCALVLSTEVSAFARVLVDNGNFVRSLRWKQFLASPPTWHQKSHSGFDLCLIEIFDTDLKQLDELVQRSVPFMKVGGQIIVSVSVAGALNGTWGKTLGVRGYISDFGARFNRFGASMVAVRAVPAGSLRSAVYRGMANLSAGLRHGRWFVLPAAIVGGGILLCLSLIANLYALRRSRVIMPPGVASRVVMLLSVDAEKANR